MAVQLALSTLSSLAAPLLQPAFIQLLYFLIATRIPVTNVFKKADRFFDEHVSSPIDSKKFDFIVVGAGSAGAIVANRLVRRNFKVLLLEAGGEIHPYQIIPGFSPFMLNLPATDWMHRSVPQKFASLNSVNQESSWSTGLGLGGTGSINLMIHLRGHKKDFDNWATITGDPSWSWEGVLPYFKRYEDYEVGGDEVNHGYGGDLRVETPDAVGVAPEFVRAARELGYPQVDLNAPFGGAGFDVARYPTKRGKRIATYKAFIEPIRRNRKLTIMKYALVNKILFRNGSDAYGIQFDKHGRQMTAYATKEIILTAGTVGSTKLLMLSGIGPKEHLDELNIPIVADLPVGENLQDHLGVYLGPFIIREPRTTNVERDITSAAMLQWLTKGLGPLTTTGASAAGLFASNVAKSRGEAHWPDIIEFLYCFAISLRALPTQAQSYNLKLDEMQKYYKNVGGKDACHLIISGARPASSGYIKLGGSSPYDKPIIDPQYLQDFGDLDLKVLLEAVKTSMVLMENTTSFGSALGASFTKDKLPGCENFELRSDEYWICFIRRYSVTLHHPVGTCAMGTVVDTELRVLGTRNLRVMDGSIQPQIVTTNTQASIMMTAEKGVDMVMKKWKGY